MHLCVVTGTHHPETSGPATYLYHLLPELCRRGHTIEVITFTDESESGYASDGYPYPVYRVSRQQAIPWRLLEMTRQVARAGRGADAIFVSDYGLPAALANLALRKPVVLKSVSDFAWEFATRKGWLPSGMTIDDFQQRRHSRRVRLVQWLQRMYVGAARLVIAPSHYSASLARGWGIPEERLRVIHNAPDLKQFGALPSRPQARAELGLDAEPLLVAVGRLTPWKCFDRILAALPDVQAQFPNAQLVIVGDGPERSRLQQLATPLGGAVEFTGALPAEHVHRFLRAADVYVQFSTYEGLPHTALEAMAAGTPVVLSDVGGNREVVQHARNGLLAPPGDVAALADYIVRLLSDREYARQLAETALTDLERFSWERLVDETEAVLLEATRGAPTP